jgi:hypothetical protein
MVIGAAGAVGAVLPPHAANVKPRAATPAEIKRLPMLSPSLFRTPRGKNRCSEQTIALWYSRRKRMSMRRLMSCRRP